jgi:5'(3')-deoxyribonucleotidase
MCGGEFLMCWLVSFLCKMKENQQRYMLELYSFFSDTIDFFTKSENSFQKLKEYFPFLDTSHNVTTTHMYFLLIHINCTE